MSRLTVTRPSRAQDLSRLIRLSDLSDGMAVDRFCGTFDEAFGDRQVERTLAESLATEQGGQFDPRPGSGSASINIVNPRRIDNF